jgi:hypothetical protein
LQLFALAGSTEALPISPFELDFRVATTFMALEIGGSKMFVTANLRGPFHKAVRMGALYSSILV